MDMWLQGGSQRLRQHEFIIDYDRISQPQKKLYFEGNAAYVVINMHLSLDLMLLPVRIKLNNLGL